MKTRTHLFAWSVQLLCFALFTFVPVEADAQGFLKKLKQKAEKSIGKMVMGEEPSVPTTTTEDETPPTAMPTAADRIPKLRKSSVVWDAEVQPSSASTVSALLNELPPLPGIDEVVHPDEAARTAYYNRLMAVNLRVDQLDNEWTCSDEEMLALREKTYKEMEGITGLSVAEMKRMEDPNTPEAERTALEEKVRNHLLGGVDLEGISARAQGKEARMEQLEKEIAVIEKKQKNGTLTAADQQRATEISQEMMSMQQEMFGGLGNLVNASKQATALTQQITGEQAAMNRKLKAISDKAAALRKDEAGVVKSCEEIAATYEEQLQSIYKQVGQATDVDAIHSLYDQADELMKNYRTRAAKLFLQGLQVRIDNTKKLLPEVETLYKEMADNKWIPACAMRRAPLNIVTLCGDLLNEAYASFPQPAVLPVDRSTFAFLKPEEQVLYGESGFAGGMSMESGTAGGTAGGSGAGIEADFINGSHLLVYNTQDKCFYEIKGGQRQNLGQEQQGWNYEAPAKRPDTVYGDIPLRKAGRKATYTRDGMLTLHDGTMLYPLMIRRYVDRLEFIVSEYDRDSREQFVKCVYKL
jgi:hypothetical protein